MWRATLPLEELNYVLFAERFGWTPQQVDEIPADLFVWLQPILATIDHVRKEKDK